MQSFAINGFGRIGRLATRVWWQYHREELKLSAINTSGSMDITGWAHLLKYDTTYGLFPGEIAFESYQSAKDATDTDPLIGYLIFDTQYKVPVFAQRDPAKIPWGKYEIEVVIESTGAFTSGEKAKAHLTGGAKQVVISAPAKGGNVPTSVIGVNEEKIVSADHQNTIAVLNNASCTTNCVAPVALVIQERLGIAKAAMTTIHSYTDDQNLQDASHKDLRRARAAAQNIVPTTTGAAIATTETIPELKGLFDGIALRVPTITGSLTDFSFVVKRKTTVDEVNNFFRQATLMDNLSGILAVTDEPIVSSDIIGHRESAIVDLALTQVIDGDLVKVFAWYDNEWGYSNRLVETVIDIANA
ncbi:MAG: type I glyceraldehyde-3-phosphate dehydrogenase [bacterium]